MAAFNLDSTPYPTSSVPFANEDDVQEFVEQNAKSILGLDVIASSKRGRGGLLGIPIDILAIDSSHRLFIIEVKWDVVHGGALQQLERYKAELLSGWDRLEALVSRHVGKDVEVDKTDLVLVTVGYRCDSSLLTNPQAAYCLTYVYDNLRLAGDVLKRRRPGKVSLHRVGEAGERHPSVSKIFSTYERLERCPQIRQAFWTLDTKLQALHGVKVTYLGKGFVSYRIGKTIFTRAEIGPKLNPKSIQWRFRRQALGKQWDGVAEMVTAADENNVYRILRDAYVDRTRF